MSKSRNGFPADPEKMFRESIEYLYDMIDANLSVKKYNYENSATLHQIEGELFSRITETAKTARKTMKQFTPEQQYEASKKCVKKRASVLAHYAQQVHEKYASKYPSLCVENVFFDTNFVCSPTTVEFLDKAAYITYAVSLWILDELQEAGKIAEAIKYLPDFVYEEDVDIPDFDDSCHSRELICRMMYVIANRNDDSCNNSEHGTFVDDATILLKNTRTYQAVSPNEELSCRERFDSIISLINPIAIQRATKRFEEKEWEILEMCLDVVNTYRVQEVSLLKEIRAELENRESEYEKLNKDADDFIDRLNGANAKAIFPLSNPQIPPMNQYDIFAEGKNVIMESMRWPRVAQSKFDKCKELDKKKQSISFIALSTSSIGMLYAEGSMEKDFAEKFNYFCVKNPYETLFAFLYLMDSGNELPWLYNQTIFLLMRTVEQLPWAFASLRKRDWDDEPDDEPEDDDYVCEEPEPVGDEDENDDALDTPEPIDWIDEESKLYSREYTDACLWCDPDEADPNRFLKMNLAQIIFENSDLVAPRNVSYDFDTAPLLEKSGFESKEAKVLERYFTLARSQQYKDIEDRIMRQVSVEAEPDDEEVDAQNDVEETIAEDVSSYKKEIVRLKDELHSLHQNRNEFRKKAEDLATENDELKQELSELRELLHSSKETVNEDSTKEKIEFPYTLNHRFVVYGGHPSWLREIKKLLNNIRFIDGTVLPNSNLMLNSDAVWIQSNAIGHAFYYKILDVTRTHSIPLEYFTYASAEKCAEQIVEYDKNIKD